MIRIVTDTTASFTPEEYQKYNIIPVPLYICQNDQTWREMFDISYTDFYKNQRNGEKYTTSQPDPNSFLDVFRAAIEAGDEVVCITISSRISGTINSANTAVQLLNTDKISLVDSRQSGAGQGSMAIKAAELARAGANRSQIVTALEEMRNRTRIYFIVESLRYLYEGGRLSGAQALFGSLIQIKPIIWFDDAGIMGSLEKIRSLKAAKNRVLEILKEQAKLGVEQAALHFGDNFEEAALYAQQMEEILQVSVPLVKVSPVVGTHTGPDLLGPMIITKT